MNKKYEIEALLRPAVEMNTAFASFFLIFVLISAPGAIFMTPTVANYSAVIFAIIGIIRLRQGLKIIKYKKNLKRLPMYSIKPEDIPVSNKVMFLGKGFEWDQCHQQRLRDISLYGGKKYTRPSTLYRFARWFELKIEKRKLLSRIFSFLSSNSFLNPVRPLPPVGGQPELHAVGMYEGEKNIYMNLAERVGHTLVPGATRNGKTRFAEIMIYQDVLRGDGCFVFDPKCDPDLMRTTYNAAMKAGRKCYVFHLGFPDLSARYNPIGQFSKITEVSTRITDRAADGGNSAVFKMFGWRYINIIAQALVYIGEIPDYLNINEHILVMDKLFVLYSLKYFETNKFENYEEIINEIEEGLDPKKQPNTLKNREVKALAILQFIEGKKISDPIMEGLMSTFKLDKSYYDKIVASMSPLLDQLTTGRTAELLSPDYFDLDDPREIFDFKSAIQQNAVVYIALDCLTDSTVGGAVGAAMFSDCTSTFGYLQKHGLNYGQDLGNEEKKDLKVSIHGDEFAELIGPATVTMLNKGGGAGLQFTAYTQTGADITVGMDSQDRAQQIIGNFNNIFMMKVKGKETAQLITDQLPDVQVSQLTVVTTAKDSSNITNNTHFESSNEDRKTTETVPILSPAQIMSLPKGQAFVFSESRLYKIRIPMAKQDRELPSTLEVLAKKMEQNYNDNYSEDWYKNDSWGEA